MTTKQKPVPLTAVPTPELRERYLAIARKQDLLKQEREILAETIKARIPESQFLDAGNGYAFVLQTRQTKEYSKPVLRKYLDEDQMDLVLKPDSRKVEELLKKVPVTAEAEKELKSSMVVLSESTALTLRQPKR